jgi:hypothetical protein
MKLSTLIILATLLISCITSKQTSSAYPDKPTEESVTPEIIDENTFIGIVHLNKEGCDLLIVLEDSGATLYPVGLDEMFRLEGAALQFKFGPSRAMLTEGCEKTKAVVLREIVRLKR